MLSRPPRMASRSGNHVIVWSNRGVGPFPFSVGLDHLGATFSVTVSGFSRAVPKSRTYMSSYAFPWPP